MPHTIQAKTRLTARVRRIRGQVEAVERALETEAGCAEVLQLIASVRGAVNGLMAEIVEGHLRVHVVAPAALKRRTQAADELSGVVKAYLR